MQVVVSVSNNCCNISLEDAHAALPENGETFAQSVVGLSKKIAELFMQGHSGQEIADKLRKDVWPKKRASF